MAPSFFIKSGIGVVGAAALATAIIVGASPSLGPKDGEDLPGIDLDRVTVGDLAPDFSLLAYAGDVVTLSDYRGDKNVILVFYRGHW